MNRTLSERLAQARRLLGVREWRDVRRNEIAAAAGVDPSMVTLYEQGRNVPSEEVIERLARFMGVTPAWIRYGDDAFQLPPMDYGQSNTGAEVKKPRKRGGGGA